MVKSLFQKKTPSLIGLDIGTRFVKAVVLEKKADQIHLQAVACEPIVGNAFQEREVHDFDAVSNALKKVKLALKSKNKSVAIAVSGASVISKVVYMEPDQNDFELESQIEIEADSLIPYPLEEVYLDFEELGDSQSHAGKVDVLLSAAHRDMVDKRITLIREVPYEPKVVDVEGYALGNALSNFYAQEQSEQPLCCINIGASLLQLCVLKDDRVIYSKEHSFGMDNLLQDLGMMHGLERQEAQQKLLTDQLPEDWREDTFPIFVGNLQQQISRALQVYMTSTHAARPEKLLISGGGAVTSELAESLASELNVEVEIFNPFANIQISEKVHSQLKNLAPMLAIAAGLASRSFDQWHI